MNTDIQKGNAQTHSAARLAQVAKLLRLVLIHALAFAVGKLLKLVLVRVCQEMRQSSCTQVGL